MLDDAPAALGAKLLQATSPGMRRLVVRVRPPTGGMNEWLSHSRVAVAASVEDLSHYSDAEALTKALAEAGDTRSSQRALELLLFASLRAGDVVIAGDDTGKVFAIGLVEGGYSANATEPARHHVGVRWWTEALPRKISAPPAWRYQEVCEVQREILNSLMMESRRTKTLPEPPFGEIVRRVANAGLRLPENIVRRYHIALKSRGFVILAGISGTGKTWLAELYARSVGARHLVVPVAPNWTSNEDLLGYLNPLDGVFHPTEFSLFLEEAAGDHREAREHGRQARPFHLILDEMNLARVEHYFAKFLSAMELRSRSDNGEAQIELGPGKLTIVPPNLLFIGTVNIDETTHGFADKVYDRAQLVELGAPRNALQAHVGDAAHGAKLMDVWDAVAGVAPFAFRVLDDINAFIAKSAELEVGWPESLDEQILQKILPKLKGSGDRVGQALVRLVEVCGDDLPLSRDRARRMFEEYQAHGFASFF